MIVNLTAENKFQHQDPDFLGGQHIHCVLLLILKFSGTSSIPFMKKLESTLFAGMSYSLQGGCRRAHLLAPDLKAK